MSSYSPKIRRLQGGNTMEVDSGGVVNVLSGGGVNVASGGGLNLASGASSDFGGVQVGNIGIPAATVVAGGTALANANAVGQGYSRVTLADDTAAVILPASVAGKVCTIKNTVANKILIVFPPAVSQINAKGVNNSYNLAAGSVRTFRCFNSVLWETDLETIA